MSPLHTTRRRTVALLVAVALVGISLYLFSPWHRHDRLTARHASAQTQFELSSLDGPADQIHVAPPVSSYLAPAGDAAARMLPARAALVLGPRAPPCPSL